MSEDYQCKGTPVAPCPLADTNTLSPIPIHVTLLLLPTVPGLQVADGGPRAGDDLLLCVAVVDPAAGAGAAQPGRAPGHVAGAGGALAADQGAGTLSTLTQVVS